MFKLARQYSRDLKGEIFAWQAFVQGMAFPKYTVGSHCKGSDHMWSEQMAQVLPKMSIGHTGTLPGATCIWGSLVDPCRQVLVRDCSSG
jgi:hypothetical protein